MTLSRITPTKIAAPLAAFLPARQGTRWTVGHAPYSIRNNVPTSRLTNGRHALIVAEEAGRIEVFADRPGTFPVHPDVVVDATDPDAVVTLASRVMLSVLPDLDRDQAHETGRTKGWEQVLTDRWAELSEVGYALLDLGAIVTTATGVNGPGLTWKSATGGTWELWAYGQDRTITLTYDGPVSGLYAFLSIVGTPYGGHDQERAGSAFTRLLTDRFTWLSPVNDHEVQFGARRFPSGFVALPSTDEPTDHADDTRRAVAQVGALCVDLLLATTTHLI
ncbi:hypothetical protein [Streptomyces sp. MBT33]|uniref:hypothetical protein n=1 Tax=Streptomyces sp. MBT33 TaxID=1488363 RepID=UPI00190A4B5A|nr:hypothetical protein [Streptomyces sp. MBT33]MBK3647920.1 hypothetical protein [Streptomyces sp. MBT33]